MLWGIANAQTTGYFRYDSVRFEKVGGNSEFILLNSTRNVINGVLVNKGNGRTEFRTIPTGIDTIYRRIDSVFMFKQGSERFAFIDSTGDLGTLIPKVISVEESITLSEPEGIYDIIEVNTGPGSVVLTLPNIPAGKGYIIKKRDGSNPVTFETLEGEQTLTNQGDAISIYSLGFGSYSIYAQYPVGTTPPMPSVITVLSSSSLTEPSASYDVIEVNASGGAVTLTLPSMSTGKSFVIKKIDASANAVNFTTSEGAQSITTQWAGAEVYRRSSSYAIIRTF